MTGIALVAFRTILAVFSYNLTKVHSAAVSISDDQFSGCIDRRFSNADTVFAVFTIDTVFTIASGITFFTFRTIHTPNGAEIQIRSACQTNVQLTVVDCNTFDTDAIPTVSSILTVLSRIAFFTFSPNNCAKVLNRAIRISQNQFAKPIDLGLLNAVSILAMFSGFAFITLGTDHAADVGTLSIREDQYQFTFGVDLGSSHAYPITAVLTGVTAFSFRAVCTHDPAKVHSRSVCIGNDQFTGCVDCRFSNTNAVFAVFAIRSVLPVFTILTGIALITLGANHTANISALSIGKHQHKFTVSIDLSRSYTDTIRAVRTDNFIQINASPVRKSHHKMPFAVDYC